MADGPYPCFLDVEATGFGEDSYPIEVAWSDPSGEIFRCLISPETIPGWTAWSSEAEKIHHIDRDRLLRNGWPPDYVADRIEEELGGCIVYTDAPDYDGRWLNQLFHAVGRSLPCTLEHIDELLISILRRPDEMVWQVIARIDKLKREVAEVSIGKHSAGYDVGYLLQLWRRATGHEVKMNHGIGPMPEITPTGTFIRVKVDS